MFEIYTYIYIYIYIYIYWKNRFSAQVEKQDKLDTLARFSWNLFGEARKHNQTWYFMQNMQKGNPLTPVRSKHTFAIICCVPFSSIQLNYARLSSTTPTNMSLICSTKLGKDTQLDTLAPLSWNMLDENNINYTRWLHSAETCSAKLDNTNKHDALCNPCPSLAISPDFFLSLDLSRSPSISLDLSISRDLSRFFPIHLDLYRSLSIPLDLFRALSISVDALISLDLFLSLAISFDLSRSLSIRLAFSRSLSITRTHNQNNCSATA